MTNYELKVSQLAGVGSRDGNNTQTYDGHNVDTVQRAVPKYPNEGSCGGKVPNDPVNSPSHYTDGGIETIDFIEAKKLSYNTGNAVKYITRAGKKNPNGCIWTDFQRDTFAKQDLEKAVWYLQREIKNLKTKLE